MNEITLILFFSIVSLVIQFARLSGKVLFFDNLIPQNRAMAMHKPVQAMAGAV
ncbi:hypothetical protein [Noviherbaspirillum sedimenti]|uniref:hypothetical protein n=1 Tax=Noviherbaspirillum sedimenti TaxID=2320865 RepID=UPI001313F9B7|nr:hypothetical protein [Noviherbaspirillum sedimenti]